MKGGQRTARGARGGPGTRVLGGELGGRRLTVAPATRPSSAQLRAALASIWAERIRGAHLLDLFAGSGAVGLELLSRGAEKALFVESDRAASLALASNVGLAGAGRAHAWTMEASRALKRLAAEGERFDLIFVDPPYEQELDATLFIAVAGVAAPGAGLAVERRARTPLPSTAPWRALGARRYGDAELHLFDLEGAAADEETPLGRA